MVFELSLFPPKITENEYIFEISFDDQEPISKRIYPNNLLLQNLEYLSDFQESFSLKILRYFNNEQEIKEVSEKYLTPAKVCNVIYERKIYS